MTSAVERILAEINSLTPAEQEELRGLIIESPTPRSRASAQLINEIKGKYAFVATSSDSFAARKREEMELEERRHGNGQ